MTEETNKAAGPGADEAGEIEAASRPKQFSQLIYVTFYWCMIGVSIIFGIRLWFDVPMHQSFIPIVGAVFAAVLAFTLVISIQQVVGPINIKTSMFSFEGATGPIVFWCICFLSIVFGLYLLGLSDVTKAEYKQRDHAVCSVTDLFRSACRANSGGRDLP
jgi:hypothetical protein